MQKKLGVVATISLCVLVGGGLAFRAAIAQAPPKPGESVVKIQTDKMKDVAPAEFSHPAHQKAFGQEKLDCKPCHMQPPPLFTMKKRAANEVRSTMEDMKAGKSCGKCHDGKTAMNGKTAFDTVTKDNCVKCHKK